MHSLADQSQQIELRHPRRGDSQRLGTRYLGDLRQFARQLIGHQFVPQQIGIQQRIDHATPNRRAQQIGLDPLFPNEENPFPWMSEMIDLKKEKNFFETRVTEYQTGGALAWD